MPITDHPNYTEIELERVAMFTRFVTAQTAYGTTNNKYLQCLITPALDRDGTSTVAFDRTRKPSDEVNNWSSILREIDIISGTRCQYYIDRYDGPAGNGYILNCRLVWSGITYLYREHHGPESRSGTFNQWVVND